jgi:hypothetical protein
MPPPFFLFLVVVIYAPHLWQPAVIAIPVAGDLFPTDSSFDTTTAFGRSATLAADRPFRVVILRPVPLFRGVLNLDS